MSKNTSKTRVLVTAVGGRSVGYQILESLFHHKDDYYIVTTDMDAFSPGLYEADKGYVTPKASDPMYIEKMLQLVEKERIDVLLSGCQPDDVVISKHVKEFEKKGVIVIMNPEHVISLCYDKNKLNDFLHENDILIPKTVRLLSIEDASDLQFPVVIKPGKDSTGSKHVHIVKDMGELAEMYKTLGMDKKAFFAQEYVSSEDEEYTVGVLIKKGGTVIDSIVMKRYLTGLSRGEEREINGRSYVLSTGYSQGFFVNRPDIKSYCEQVAKQIGARGPLNIQCRRGERGVYIFEVHPRFSGSASMRAAVGFNEPHVLIRDYLGLESYTSVSHVLDQAVIRKFANVVVPMEKYEHVKKV